jgi:signal peptidase
VAGTVLATASLLVVLAALAAVVVVPRAAGAAPLVVLTGSMAPGIPAGSVVVVRPVDARTLAVGDVVTYEAADGSGALVTHRVTALGHDAAGEVQLTTRGDANTDADLDPVPASAVRGELWYRVPWVGYASDLLSGTVAGLSERVLAVLLAGAALAVYAAVQLVGAATERRRRTGAAPASPAWGGRTASRELLVATLDVAEDAADPDLLDRFLEVFSATVLATTDTTVSITLAAPPAVVDDAVTELERIAPVHVQRSGPLLAPLGPGTPHLAGGRDRRGRARDAA